MMYITTATSVLSGASVLLIVGSTFFLMFPWTEHAIKLQGDIAILGWKDYRQNENFFTSWSL